MAKTFCATLESLQERISVIRGPEMADLDQEDSNEAHESLDGQEVSYVVIPIPIGLIPPRHQFANQTVPPSLTPSTCVWAAQQTTPSRQDQNLRL